MGAVASVRACPASWVALAEHNFAAHASALARLIPATRIAQSPRWVAVDCGLACDTLNITCQVHVPSSEGESVINEVERFYGGMRAFSWWVGTASKDSAVATDSLPSVLRRRGYIVREECPAMRLELEHLRDPAPPAPAFEVRAVRSRADLQRFGAVLANNWQPADVRVAQFYRSASDRVGELSRSVVLYVGERDGRAVSVGESVRTGEIVGLYSIATLETERGNGFASALTYRMLVDARAAGARHAVLEASRAGLPLYAALGFAPFGLFLEFSPPPDACLGPRGAERDV